MEGIIFLILIALVIYLIYLLVVYVIAPIAAILSIVSLIMGVGYAFIVSIMSFFKSFVEHINPYATYIDKKSDKPSGVRRSYFFGPGYHQIGITVKYAFKEQKKRVDALAKWRNGVSAKLDGNWLVIWVWLFYFIAYLCTFVLGFAWIAVFSTILFSVNFVGMCVFYVFFTLLWVTDRLVLAAKSIQSRCANCKRISIVPVFLCPNCGMEHKKLTPGPYGIFHRKCVCGEQLPTTFINGRSFLKATCPFCATDLAASDARQFGIQLVGGVSAGKTTFLAAFWHEYLERVKCMTGVSITASPEDAFAQLEYWFQHGDSSATTETNANMYSLIHKYGNKTPVQMTIYDIAGEAFASLAEGIQQQQFQYCEGIVFVIDPTANPVHVSETVSGFVHEFAGLKGRHSMKMSDVPVAVIITKADLYKRDIGLPKIRAVFESSARKYADADGNTSLEFVRNGICRGFLEDHDFGNTVNLIDAEFNRVQYYAVSAMGHPAAAGQKYEPWGVLEPIVWLMKQQGIFFQDVVSRMYPDFYT
ncbi:MAG: GTPase domain-containing protein [Holophagales bacterium]|jgi:GTPase SAR1 family protein|nr:GTPase domain-containing protein [Holophagales bacterium]